MSSGLGQQLRRVMPAAWFDDLETGRPGAVRRTLKRVGPSWVAAPWRRIIQSACFVAFLILFLHVCWPYSARPEPVWRGVQPRALRPDQSLSLHWPEDLRPPIAVAEQFYLSDDASTEPNSASIGAFRVVAISSSEIELAAVDSIPTERWEALRETPGGSWSVSRSPPDAWPSHYTDELARKEGLPAEIFLVLDPLVAISTSIASRTAAWSLGFALAILVVGLLVPRGFCGYLCPLGTLIDLFDATIGRRVTRFRVAGEGWWVHLKYYLLLATLIAAFSGVLVTGFVAAIPIITRAMLFVLMPFQIGALRGWHLVPPFQWGQLVSLILFGAVLALGLLRPRFWCKYVCPSGAVFSLGNVFRFTERKVETSCIHCNKCVEICPFDAIKPDFTTRTTDCTWCQSCGGVCPTQAIKFVERWNRVELKVLNDPPTGETSLGRRGFMSLAAGLSGALVGGGVWAWVTRSWGAGPASSKQTVPVRPPGSVPEPSFLQLCIRCGECFQVCPNNVLQPLGLQHGLDGLWTPHVVADWAGCESSCNACGQVCPTGAIRALALEEKRVARMGLAIVNRETCLPFAGREACQLCVDECVNAGYRAIEFLQVGTEVDDEGQPVEGSGFLAPVVLADKCVGCGLCHSRCYGFYVQQKGLLNESAIVIYAGDGHEDRLLDGSYQALRAAERQQRASQQPKTAPAASDYLPDFLQ
jgi:NAD-dependent dihydropyrimidine dehydrogenase PreA subunit